jgi:hypothetical protein
VTHGDPNNVDEVATNRAVIAYAARRSGVEAPEALIDSLIAHGLLVELLLRGDEMREFARHHQVMPLALGLGNSPQNPAEYQIGLPNAARASVGHDIYHMWLFTRRWATLWDAVTAMAQEAEEANAEERTSPWVDKVELVADPDVMLRAMIRALPMLVATSCVYIDRTR